MSATTSRKVKSVTFSIGAKERNGLGRVFQKLDIPAIIPKAGPKYGKIRLILRVRLTVGLQILDLPIGVRIPDPQPAYAPPVTRVSRKARVFLQKNHFEKRGL